MTKGSIVIRMYASTLKKIKREFPSVKGETMISYFERLSKSLQELNEENEDTDRDIRG